MRRQPFAFAVVCAALSNWMAANVVAADAKPSVALKKVAEGFVSPINLIPLDDNSGRLLVVDQVGVVYVLGKDGAVSEKPFLDITNRLATLNRGFDERGLLGLALHPQFKQNRKFYVCYSAPLRASAPQGEGDAKWDHTMNISEFKVTENDRAQADGGSERILLQLDKAWFNHNGGAIAFGPDGFLYISVGDGGNANDEGKGHTPGIGNGQDLTNLFGKILRIDVDKGNPYAIPTDNPFANGGGRPEIFAYGLRNSWRISFDRGGKHELFAADIGQTLYEEVNIIVKGGNYGWRVREGFHCFDPKNPKKSPDDCPKTDAQGKPFIDPIFEYKNVNGFRNDPEALGISITGGYVYRGKALPELQGRYVFADWSRNFVVPQGVLLVGTPPGASGSSQWNVEALPFTGPSEVIQTSPKLVLKAFVVAMGEDADGELYVLSNSSNGLIGKSGKVHKLVAP